MCDNIYRGSWGLTNAPVVEYTDPSGVFRALRPDFQRHLPLRDLNWTSGSRPLRSIPTLHLDFVENAAAAGQDASLSSSREELRGGQTQSGTEPSGSDTFKQNSVRDQGAEPQKERRHQIPGLRPTPYLKVYLLQCNDLDSYKDSHRRLLKEWVKGCAQAVRGNASTIKNENHNASEWLIILISDDSGDRQSSQGSSKTRSEFRWSSKSPKGLLEKIRADFNGSSKTSPDRVAQLSLLDASPNNARPSASPAQPNTERQWDDVTHRLKSLILASFDLRVKQYEEDIKEKDSQRALPGWNFNTFFLLKEGLALGFESVGLLEDALSSYQELAAGLNIFVKDREATSETTPNQGHFRSFSKDVLEILRSSTDQPSCKTGPTHDEAVNESRGSNDAGAAILDISVKPYRDMILANDISLFDFQCYIYARQMLILFRMANVVIQSRRQYKLRSQTETQTAQGLPAPTYHFRRLSQSRQEDTRLLSEICRCTLDFVGVGAASLRDELLAASIVGEDDKRSLSVSTTTTSVVDDLVMSWTFSICQSVLDATLLADLVSQLKPLIDNFRPNAANIAKSSDEASSTGQESPNSRFPDRNRSPQNNSPGKRQPSPEKYPSITNLDALRLLPPPATQSRLQNLAASRADLLAFQRRILSKLGFQRASWWCGRFKLAEIDESSMDDESSLKIDAKLKKSEAAVILNTGLASALLNEGAFCNAYEV